MLLADEATALHRGLLVAITGSLLIVPYVTWYDSTLLALPIAVIYARGRTTIRIICASVVTAIPLWVHGGGNNGPIGFTHVGVELFIIGYFAHLAGWLRTPLRLSTIRAIRAATTTRGES